MACLFVHAENSRNKDTAHIQKSQIMFPPVHLEDSLEDLKRNVTSCPYIYQNFLSLFAYSIIPGRSLSFMSLF